VHETSVFYDNPLHRPPKTLLFNYDGVCICVRYVRSTALVNSDALALELCRGIAKEIVEWLRTLLKTKFKSVPVGE
jgi:hypothetical protein